MTDPGPDDPVDLSAWRRPLPPDEAWPLAVLTLLGWYVLLVGGLAWLAYGPLAPTPRIPGERPTTGWAGLNPGLDVLVRNVVGPLLLTGLVVSLVLCRLASPQAPVSQRAGVWRGTWTFLLGLPCACVVHPLVLLVTAGRRLDR